jgi:hypothetical protein
MRSWKENSLERIEGCDGLVIDCGVHLIGSMYGDTGIENTMHRASRDIS